ncbi:MAG: serine acetyltransferase [Myxococcales bacterium]|nr:serine acetyltransferase [Myxococcales bacterium]
MEPLRSSAPHIELVDRLLDSYRQEGPLQIQAGHELPSFEEVRLILHTLRELVFPGYSGESHPTGGALRAAVAARIADVQMRLQRQVFRGLHHRCKAVGADCVHCEERTAAIVATFLDDLPGLRHKLLADVRAAYEGDPAATGTDEVVFSYPGPQAITVYRFAHRILELGAVIVPRMMTEQAHATTGVDIHPGATIGEALFIDHGTGIVIGETTVIGDRVRIYQGVTLGALSLPTGKARLLSQKKRHPTIEDEVIIYANATILGGDTVIGQGAVIGGNAFITESVPAGARRSV